MKIDLDDLTIGQLKDIKRFLDRDHVDDLPFERLPFERLAEEGRIVIAVLQRGHVAVGEYSQTGLIGCLKKAAIVRRWGTTNGLGELAENGPRPNTILDKCPELFFHIREAVFIMEVNSDAWRKSDV